MQTQTPNDAQQSRVPGDPLCTCLRTFYTTDSPSYSTENLDKHDLRIIAVITETTYLWPTEKCLAVLINQEHSPMFNVLISWLFKP